MIQATWVKILCIVLVVAILISTPPVYASSIFDFFSPVNSVNNEQTKNVFQMLLFSVLGNLFPKNAGTPGSHPVDAQPRSPQVIGFYAEWWQDDKASFESFKKNIQQVNIVAPYWATMQSDGTILERNSSSRDTMIKFAKENRVPVLLLVNNAKAKGTETPPIQTVLNNPVLRKKAVSNIENYLKKYQLDGVNIDFEIIPGKDRDNLTAFMRELWNQLKPQGYIVTIDVFPKQNENDDISAAYDYAQLARYADKLIVMTYDNHGKWSGPGPVADIRWVETTLKYALNYISPEQLYLGVAAYGYDWSKKGTESLAYPAVSQLQQRYSVSPKWDDRVKAPYFSYTDPSGIDHQVWFENSESLKYKLDLVNKYHLAGIALWKLGDEDPGYWHVLKSKLN